MISKCQVKLLHTSLFRLYKMADASNTQSDSLEPKVSEQGAFVPVGQHVAAATTTDDGELDQKMVEEIESLCMNCHEDVGTSYVDLQTSSPFLNASLRAQLDSFSPRSPSFEKSSSCPFPAHIVT